MHDEQINSERGVSQFTCKFESKGAFHFQSPTSRTNLEKLL